MCAYPSDSCSLALPLVVYKRGKGCRPVTSCLNGRFDPFHTSMMLRILDALVDYYKIDIRPTLKGSLVDSSFGTNKRMAW